MSTNIIKKYRMKKIPKNMPKHLQIEIVVDLINASNIVIREDDGKDIDYLIQKHKHMFEECT